jgi:hypothetical protein
MKCYISISQLIFPDTNMTGILVVYNAMLQTSRYLFATIVKTRNITTQGNFNQL